MNEQELREHSAAKLKQVFDLLQTLHLVPQAKQRAGKDGFVETVVVWRDDEKYDVAPGTVADTISEVSFPMSAPKPIEAVPAPELPAEEPLLPAGSDIDQPA